MESKEQANNKLIDLLEVQINELVLMSKIELGDDVIEEIKRLKEIINTKTTIKSLEEEAEQFAKTRTELDPVYANGLYYGFIECGKSEWFKEQIKKSFLEGAEMGEMFNNENRAFTSDAENYYNQEYTNNK
jgi:flavodoxin